MVNIRLGKIFNQQYRMLILQNPELGQHIDQKILQFKNNPNDTRLKNHALKKRMRGKWAFSIAPDIRIVYEKIGIKTVRFLAIGTHEEVYGEKTKFLRLRKP